MLTCLHFSIGSCYRCGGFLDIRRVSSSPELSPFCSACASIPWNLPQILSSGFFEEGASITQASVGENVALSSFFELIDMFRHIPCFSSCASSLLQRFLKCSILKFWSPRNSLQFTFLHDSLRWTLSLPSFCVAQCSLGELRYDTIPIFQLPAESIFLWVILGHTTHLYSLLPKGN